MPAFTAVAYVPVIILERPLFLRERNDGLYRVITYLSFKISEVCWVPPRKHASSPSAVRRSGSGHFAGNYGVGSCPVTVDSSVVILAK